jgi:protein-disulfide isomerase
MPKIKRPTIRAIQSLFFLITVLSVGTIFAVLAVSQWKAKAAAERDLVVHEQQRSGAEDALRREEIRAAVREALADEQYRQQVRADLVIAFREFIRETVVEEEVGGQAAPPQPRRERTGEVPTLPDSLMALTSADFHGHGRPDAMMIVYTDYECPFCKRMHESIEAFRATHPQGMYIRYRHFPLPNVNPVATRQALAAECVWNLGGPEKGWAFSGAVFAATGSGGRGVEDLDALIEVAGVEPSLVRGCMSDPATMAAIRLADQEARALRVTGTPATIITRPRAGAGGLVQEGARFVSGAVPPHVLDQMLVQASRRDAAR